MMRRSQRRGYSGAVDEAHDVVLGSLLIASTVVMTVFVAHALMVYMKKHSTNDTRDNSPDSSAVEIGALSSVAEDSQADPGRKETIYL